MNVYVSPSSFRRIAMAAWCEKFVRFHSSPKRQAVKVMSASSCMRALYAYFFVGSNWISPPRVSSWRESPPVALTWTVRSVAVVLRQVPADVVHLLLRTSVKFWYVSSNQVVASPSGPSPNAARQRKTESAVANLASDVPAKLHFITWLMPTLLFRGSNTRRHYTIPPPRHVKSRRYYFLRWEKNQSSTAASE